MTDSVSNIYQNTKWIYKRWYEGLNKTFDIGLPKNDDVGFPFVNTFCVDESDPNPLVNLGINKQNNTIKENIP